MIEHVDVPMRHWRYNDRLSLVQAVAIICDSCRGAGPYGVPSKRSPKYAGLLSQAIAEGWSVTIDPPRAECPRCQGAAVASALPDSVIVDLRGLS